MTHRHRKQTYGYQRGKGGEGQIRSLGSHIHTTVCQINSMDLLFSTGKYIKYFAVTYNGKESEKVCVCLYVCVCIYLDHFAVHLKLAQHCKLTVLQF